MIIALRVRGRTGIKEDIADTLDMLRLTRINHAVLLPENDSYLGMLRKGKDYITWGEIDSGNTNPTHRKKRTIPRKGKVHS